MTSRLGLLHTVPALAVSFTALAAELDDDVELVHVVDASLLARAGSEGVTEELDAAVAAHVRHLAGRGTGAVLVTCSSIGECADAAADAVPVPVLRVDRPMARSAVDIAAAARGRITILATLGSTLTPTQRLLRSEAAGARSPVEVHAVLVDGAAAARAAGRQDRHDELVRESVREAAADSDVVVLAQASMATAVPDTGDVPVLSSPRSGLQAALAAVRGRPMN